VVGDNPERLSEAVAIARGRADILITTGGLGPTYDDLTKQTVAACFGLRLTRHDETWARIQNWFREMGRALTPNNERQALLPEGCTIFQNDWGTAPGCAFEADGKHVLMLPGPPRECLSMFVHCAVPYLRRLSGVCLVSRQVRIFGLGESAVEDKLRDFMPFQTNPTVAPYAKESEVMLRVTARAETPEQARALTEPAVAEILRALGPAVYGVDVDSLEERAAALLVERNRSLALAESCTGGLISERITEIPGVSRVYKGGVCVYAPEAKTALLGVPAALLAAHGAVSEPVARAMAEGALSRFGADLALGVTGLAGPGGDGSAHPPGTVFVALAEAGTPTVCQLLRLGADRARVRAVAASHALDMLRRRLEAIS
jgi:nicotinamide-nucleotide amidase